jgi:superfamily II DNA or RNA helicase
MTAEESALRDAIGTQAFLHARAHVDDGDVVDVRWQAEAGMAYGKVRDPGSGVVAAQVSTDAEGKTVGVTGACTCDRSGCEHPAALALTVIRQRSTQPSSRLARHRTPPWEKAMAALVDGTAPARADSARSAAELALQFDLVPATTKPGVAGSWRIALRPVVPGRSGWVRAGISWSNLGYSLYGLDEPDKRRRRLLIEIMMLSNADERYYYGYGKQALHLDEIATRRIWDLLAEAEEIGLPLVQAGKAARPVTVSRTPARVSVRAVRADDALVLAPELLVEGTPVAPESSILVGQPAHGVAWWGVRGEPEPAPKDRLLRLAQLAAPLESALAKALAGPEIRVPARDESRFLRHYYPRLVRQVQVVAAADDLGLPVLGTETLTLTIERRPGHELALAWQWTQVVGNESYGEPLHSPPPAGQALHRDNVVRRVTQLVGERAPELLEPSPSGPLLRGSARVAGDATIGLLRDVVPQLCAVEHVEVVHGDGPEYRELPGPPAISFTSSSSVTESDWFDLAVQVDLGGEQVPFEELFVALAEDRQYLILPSGAFVALDQPEFHQLRHLIAEARALQDAPRGVLRVGRFQAGLWQELAELGEITGQARAWQESVRTLTEAGDAPSPPLPAGVRADLRPYQREGFEWLARLYQYRLGGILADDMGLGKTVQTLALVSHARQLGGGSPFLVVAPASVVATWVSEAARFTPDLAVRAVTQTRARRGAELADVATGADLVVTSYNLFRLEHDDYQALKWDGLVLDEAQFIKNHQAVAHRSAKRLPAPFKLAITGTPMENNLGELWSLLSVTAPGLFPRLDRFTEYYRNPIEKSHDTERLAQLRRRVRPLMLRRRKADVVADLPPKQEQVIELDLDRRHRKVYQTYLQRERQKVLGLLGEFEQNRFEIFRSLTLLRQASLDVSLVDQKQRGVPSAKLDVLAELVGNLVAEGHRSLVFSQFTRFLAAARTRLENMGVQCCYLDGKTRNRAAVLAEFRDGAAPVFLISLKAGGFGLNLTEADYCILLDPWWNPATEEQAVDRVHRIGQTRHVMAYRLVAKDTIEEKVMALKARKAELFSSVLDGGEFASARLTASDIRALLE